MTCSSETYSHPGSILFAIVAIALLGCGDAGEDAPRGEESARRVDDSNPHSNLIAFCDITNESGIHFDRTNGFDGEHYRLVETVNGGVALLDVDGDGFLDVYFTNGSRLADADSESRPRNALYRNRGNGTFEDISRASKTDDGALSVGCAVADVTGDGHPDLYVTNLGANRLYRNDGKGSFTDVAREAGVALESLDAGCAFFDMDSDGDLDLYVASYVVEPHKGKPPVIAAGVRTYGSPLHYPAAPDHLFENRGDGTFVDVSESAGIRSVPNAAGLGVVAADVDGDGAMDLVVANDAHPNFLFIGDGRGRFTDEALVRGIAFSSTGKRQGSMGLAIADLDGDELAEIFITNFDGEYNNFYRAVDAEFYEDIAPDSVVGRGSLPEVGWGVGIVDFDNDGWRDLLYVNGHIRPRAKEVDDGASYAQRARIFRNLGSGRLEELGEKSGNAIGKARVSRGTAFGDLDNDGDLDVVIVNANGPPAILRNDGNYSGHWVRVRLVTTAASRSVIGTRVTVITGSRRQTSENRSSGSYLSVSDPRLHFGLGDATRIDRIEVRWPDGLTDVRVDANVDREITFTRTHHATDGRR